MPIQKLKHTVDSMQTLTHTPFEFKHVFLTFLNFLSFYCETFPVSFLSHSIAVNPRPFYIRHSLLSTLDVWDITEVPFRILSEMRTGAGCAQIPERRSIRTVRGNGSCRGLSAARCAVALAGPWLSSVGSKLLGREGRQCPSWGRERKEHRERGQPPGVTRYLTAAPHTLVLNFLKMKPQRTNASHVMTQKLTWTTHGTTCHTPRLGVLWSIYFSYRP